MNDQITWADNKRYMVSLWPKWKPTDAEAGLINSRWCHLDQAKLRLCMDNNRLKRSRVPDLAAIHQEYCKITGHGNPGQHVVESTKRYIDETRGPTEAELAEWDREAKAILATASPEEIKAAKERLGIDPDSDRILGLMVEYCREHKHRRTPRRDA
jgi:hypothetical protein